MIGLTLLNRYQIEDELGKGGMGIVYKAHDTLLKRAVAIKFLNTAGVGTEGKARLLQEARAAARLNHPNIVSVYDAGEADGSPFIVMELVNGDTLRKTEKPALSDALIMARQICLALEHAHENGIIHRDLKLENIVITNTQTLKLMDFGLARAADDVHLTEEGVIAGTLAYLAPELIQGKPASVQSDLYAFGVILYELLTGHPPFQGTINTILAQHLHGVVVPPSEHNADIPEWVDKLVLRLLAKSPEERHASAKDVLRDIEERSIAPTFASLISIAPRPKNNLPTQLTAFIGREKEVEQIKKRLEKNRLVTLTGSGGIGKTRLSIQVASELLTEYLIGVWLVELAPLTDPALVPQSVCVALGVKPEGDTTALDALINYIHEKKILLVVDNCEHLIDACAQLCDSLLHACPELRIIASSREALGIDGESSYRVPSLSLPNPKSELHTIEESEAVKLFMERATALLPEFTMTQINAPAIAQICQRLDGIALAIELAASRVKMLKVEQIATRLDDAFRLLTGGNRTALPRQQTLRALIDWSYNLLSDEERTFLRRLSVFMGGWTLEAAEAVCGNADVLDLLTHLVDKSLVSVDLEHGDEPRYYLLETVRQYAREKLVEVEDPAHLRDIHLDYFLKLAERIAPELRRRKMPYWLDYLEVEYPNFHAALEWVQGRKDEIGLRLCNALFRLWLLRGEFRKEGLEWFEKFLAASAASRTALRAWALYHTALLSLSAHKRKTLLAESLPLAREIGDHACIAGILTQIGFDELDNEDFDNARALLEESLSEARLANDEIAVGNAILGLGNLAGRQVDYETAHSLTEESLAIFKRVGDLPFLYIGLNLMGVIYSDQGNYNTAREYFEEGLFLAQEVHDRLQVSLFLRNLGDIALSTGDFDNALSFFEQFRRLIQDTPDDFYLNMVFFDIGEVARFQGNYDKAIVSFEKGLAGAKSEYWKVTFYLGLANIEQMRNHSINAKQYLFDALNILKTLKDYYFWFRAIAISAYFAVGQQQKFQAAIFFGWLNRWSALSTQVPPPVYQAEFDRYLAQVHEGLSESEFNAAWAEGQSMSQEQILALAMDVLQ